MATQTPDVFPVPERIIDFATTPFTYTVSVDGVAHEHTAHLCDIIRTDCSSLVFIFATERKEFAALNPNDTARLPYSIEVDGKVTLFTEENKRRFDIGIGIFGAKPESKVVITYQGSYIPPPPPPPPPPPLPTDPAALAVFLAAASAKVGTGLPPPSNTHNNNNDNNNH